MLPRKVSVSVVGYCGHLGPGVGRYCSMLEDRCKKSEEFAEAVAAVGGAADAEHGDVARGVAAVAAGVAVVVYASAIDAEGKHLHSRD